MAATEYVKETFVKLDFKGFLPLRTNLGGETVPTELHVNTDSNASWTLPPEAVKTLGDGRGRRSPERTEAAGKCCVRLRPAKVRRDGCERHIRQVFCLFVFFLWGLPGKQQRDEKQKKKSPHQCGERAENKNDNWTLHGKKKQTTEQKINQETSESSVETTTFIFPLQLYTIRLYTSKAVMLSSQRSVGVWVRVLGGAALGEVGVEDGCRHGDHHCDDRHPGAPAALSERQHTHTHTKKSRLVRVVVSELKLDWRWSREREREREKNTDEEEQREGQWRGPKKTETKKSKRWYFGSKVV